MNKHIIILFYIIFLIIYILYKLYENYINKTNNIINHYKPKLINFINSNLNNQSNKLFLCPLFELGDNIIINGAIRYYCQKYNTVILVCKKIYYDQISYMYQDLHNILFYVIPDMYANQYLEYYIKIDDDIDNLFKMYNIKYYNIFYNFIEYNNLLNVDYVLRTYNALNLDINIAYKYFKIVRDHQRENELYQQLISIIGNKYVIIIDDEKRNFLINKKYTDQITLPIFKLNANSNNLNPKLNLIKDPYVFNYCKILENASEIFSIDTSIPWLIDMMNMKTKTYIYNTRQGLIKYNNKNINLLPVKNKDIINNVSNINNYSIKYPYDTILSYM